jgi:hypothetical protein
LTFRGIILKIQAWGKLIFPETGMPDIDVVTRVAAMERISRRRARTATE